MLLGHLPNVSLPKEEGRGRGIGQSATPGHVGVSSEGEWVGSSTQGLTASSDAVRMQLEQGSRVYAAAAEAPIIYLNILSGLTSTRDRGTTQHQFHSKNCPRLYFGCINSPPPIFSIGSNYGGGNCMERERGGPWESLAPRLFVP